jgi:nitrite reductase/ring-hydroxylating ferredoxin subunit/uncharacterized membrane protein
MSDISPSPPPFAERLSDALQEAVKVVVGTHRKPPRRLKSLPNGTWFGHPLHPVMTDVPIVAWLVTAIFDIIWLIAPFHNSWAALGAFVAVIVGLLGALGAIATGLTDWSDTYGAERSIGLNHALFNASATILYLVSFILRILAGSGDGFAAAILGFVGLAFVFYVGYLGGELVFTKGTGVNHTAWETVGEDYKAVLPVERVEENMLYRVLAAGVPVVVLRQGKQFYAISATCPHAGGPLDEGTLTGDGRVLTGSATVNATRYDVRVRNGQVEVKRGSSA